MGNPYVNPHVNRPFNAGPYQSPENPLKGVEVTVKIKTAKTLKTDSEGIAKLNINLMAGEYIITSEYGFEKEGNTMFSFNRDVGYANLKRDIIDAHFKQEEYGFRIEAMNDNPYHWKVSFFNFDPKSHIGQDIEHMMDLSMQSTIDLELKFSTMMFPVMPPKYDFISPKLHSHTLKKIFHSGAFEKDVYNPLTKIGFLQNIRKVIERYAQIDFGVGWNTVEDYLNKENYHEQQLCKPLLGQLIEIGKEFVERQINGAFCTCYCPYNFRLDTILNHNYPCISWNIINRFYNFRNQNAQIRQCAHKRAFNLIFGLNSIKSIYFFYKFLWHFIFNILSYLVFFLYLCSLL